MDAKVLACHTEGLLTRDEACGSVTKYHGCHTKQGYATFETSESDRFCSTCQRHHIATSRERLRTVAGGCGRLRTVAQRLANTPSNPQIPRVKREPLLHIREKVFYPHPTSRQCPSVNVGGQTCPLIGPSTQPYQNNKRASPR